MPHAHVLAVKVGQPARNIQQDAVPAAVPAQEPRGACALLPDIPCQRPVQIPAFHVLRGESPDLVGPKLSHMAHVTACRGTSQITQVLGATPSSTNSNLKV